MHNKKFEFVAIDFEYATSNKGTVCAVGIATFQNGEIIDEYYSLVQPPDNEYSAYNIVVHKITPDHTKHAQTFAEIYHEIRNRVHGRLVVAHGAFHTDKHCLEQAMTSENIVDQLNIEWICTQSIVNVPLELACQVCEIELEHHNSLSDAKACGKLYHAYLNDNINFDKIEESRVKYEPQKFDYSAIFPAKLHGDVLKPDFENVKQKHNPFYKKKVVITGFDDTLKEKLAHELKNLGADVDSVVGKKTNYLIIGDKPGPSKIQKMEDNIREGRDSKIITYEEYQKNSGSR